MPLPVLEALQKARKISYEVRQGGPGSKPRLNFISRMLCALPLPRLMLFFFVLCAGLFTKLSACRPPCPRPPSWLPLSYAADGARARSLVYVRAVRGSSVCTFSSCTGVPWLVWACTEAR